MIKVRQGTFETNSSSTHSIVIVEDDQLEKWKTGELLYVPLKDKFLNKVEAEEYLKELGEDDDIWWGEKPLTCDEYFERYNDLECNETTYTTTKGEKIHIFCRYGYDG